MKEIEHQVNALSDMPSLLRKEPCLTSPNLSPHIPLYSAQVLPNIFNNSPCVPTYTDLQPEVYQ